MVDEVSSSQEASFPSGLPEGQTESLEPELQALSNQIAGPPHGKLSTQQLAGVHQFLSQVDKTQPPNSKFHQDFEKFDQDYQQMMQGPATLSSSDLQTVSKDIAAMAADSPMVSQTQLSRIMHDGLETVKGELNSGNASEIDQAKGELIAISCFLSGGPWSTPVRDMGAHIIFDLQNDKPVSELSHDVSWLLDQPEFNSK